MELFTFLHTVGNELIPEKAKIHLAGWNGFQNPLDVYLRGEFEEWQSWQAKQNFNREYIVSLIQMSESNTWLFAGVYQSISSVWNEDHYDYLTQKVELFEPYSGRLKVTFNRPGRQAYLIAENWITSITISELTSEKLVIESFKGYQNTKLSKARLDIIVSQQVSDWKSALSSVSGVYLITDLASGKLYVDSATGEGGIWQRWNDYCMTILKFDKKLRLS